MQQQPVTTGQTEKKGSKLLKILLLAFAAVGGVRYYSFCRSNEGNLAAC